MGSAGTAGAAIRGPVALSETGAIGGAGRRARRAPAGRATTIRRGAEEAERSRSKAARARLRAAEACLGRRHFEGRGAACSHTARMRRAHSASIAASSRLAAWTASS
ncbi:MAG: hypothetical protein U0359_34685 [Byssovorax sp.]